MTSDVPRLVVTTPWYPEPGEPYHGVFVRESVAALGRPADATTVIHVRSVVPAAPAAVVDEDTPLGRLLRIDVPLDPRTPRAAAAEAHRRALESHALGEIQAADIVHAHVGMPTGWAVSGLLRPDQRLVTTEHATYVDTILRRPEGHARYGELLDRTALHLAVSEHEARALRVAFPAYRDRIRVIGNPVDDRLFEARRAPVLALDRWVFVGNLIERKGVLPLVRAFGHWVERHGNPRTRLTLVGAGPQHDEVVALVARLGLGERVSLPGPCAHDQLPHVLADADLLVHLADFETFGVTVVEAAMSGLPVVTTRSAGPEETMADAVARGRTALVGRRPRPAEVVAAAERLAALLTSSDPAGTRAVLVSRYGTAAYGARLAGALATGSLAPRANAEAPAHLLLATSRNAAERLVAEQADALDGGWRVSLVTCAADDAAAADPRTRVLDLAPAIAHLPWRRATHLVVHAVPAMAIRGTRRVARIAAAVPGPWRSLGRRWMSVASGLLSHQTAAAQRVDRTLEAWVFGWLESRRVAHLVLRNLAWIAIEPPQAIVTADAAGARVAQILAAHLPGVETVNRLR